ncbi:MAG: GNAT family N-acetyltransferase [Clostridiales bacterium]|nr:GNAT family N-acetyltransferase [Clostridiales bacterium]
MQVISIIDEYFKFDEVLESIYVFDDGLVSAFMEIKETEICKLYVDPFDKAISFYQKHGFHLTNTTMDIENTNKKIVEMKR